MSFMKTLLAYLASLLLACLATQPLSAQPPPRIQSVVVAPDNRVTFRLNAPKATSVTVDGSYPITTKVGGKMVEVPMTRDDKGVWSATVGPLKPDIYEYHFTVDGLHVPDPANTAHGSGDSDWFIVPGPESANYQDNDVPHGRVSYDWYPSPTLNLTSRRLAVYTPPGYGTGTARYPVLYLLHWGGGDETSPIKSLRLPEIMDNLIAQGKVVPMIVVMPNSNTAQTLAPGTATVPGPNEPGGPRADDSTYTPYTNHVIHDVIPYIDRTYRTIADRDHRAIGGFSLGGTHAVMIGFNHLDEFSWLASFSGGSDALPGVYVKTAPPADADTRRGAPSGESIDPVKFANLFPVIGPGLNSRLHLLYIGIGDDDGLLEGWQVARKVFDEKGVKYTWLELPHYGHDPSTWRVMLLDFLPRLFKSPDRIQAQAVAPL